MVDRDDAWVGVNSEIRLSMIYHGGMNLLKLLPDLQEDAMGI